MPAPIGFGREKIHFNLAILKKQGQQFQIVIDADKAVEYKQGNADIRDVLKSEHIYSDAEKGMLASEHAIKEIFGTNDSLKVAEIILKEGEIQFTAEYRRKILEQKTNRIIDLISKNAINPQTKLPHPPERIRSAIEEAKVKIDMFKKPEDQIKDIVKKISAIIPIRIENISLKIKIPVSYAAKCYSTIKALSNIKEEEWMSDGSLSATVEIPAGLKEEFIDKLNKITHGNLELTILK
ncbi:MAG: ribosome assembly factor SBDS [Candidatus Woesearchaeota archaeon]